MSNKVLLNDQDIIEVIYDDKQTYESVRQSTDEVILTAQRLRREGKKVLILSSIEGVKKTSSEARRAAAEALELKVHDKVAVCGGNLFFKYLAKLIITATRQNKNVHHFDNREEAKRWLLNNR